MFRNITDPRFDRWWKSSRSGANQGCVECSVAADGSGLVGIADSKAPEDAPILVFGREAWSAFVSGVQRGSFGQA